jgi:hypothetical protein
VRRILMAMAAAAAGFVGIYAVVLPFLAYGRGWSAALIALSLLFGLVFLIPVALLTLAAIRPRSVPVAVGAALMVGFLLVLGMGLEPASLARVAIHLAAILGLAALIVQALQGIADRRLRVLWIVLCLLLSLPIGFLSAGMIGLHIITQSCPFPMASSQFLREWESILCSL